MTPWARDSPLTPYVRVPILVRLSFRFGGGILVRVTDRTEVAVRRAIRWRLVGGTAAGLLLVGTLLAAVQACTSRGGLASRGRRASRRDPRPTSGHAVAAIIDPSFLALRETLGAAWILRIAERFDTVADSRGWPCRLRFGGLESGGDPGDTFWHRDALRAFRALARRFVSEAWLARHGWHDAKQPSPPRP